MEKELGFGGKQRPTGEEQEVTLCMEWDVAPLLVKTEDFVLGPQYIPRWEEALEINPWARHSVVISSFSQHFLSMSCVSGMSWAGCVENRADRITVSMR